MQYIRGLASLAGFSLLVGLHLLLLTASAAAVPADGVIDIKTGRKSVVHHHTTPIVKTLSE